MSEIAMPEDHPLLYEAEKGLPPRPSVRSSILSLTDVKSQIRITLSLPERYMQHMSGFLQCLRIPIHKITLMINQYSESPVRLERDRFDGNLQDGSRFLGVERWDLWKRNQTRHRFTVGRCLIRVLILRKWIFFWSGEVLTITRPN